MSLQHSNNDESLQESFKAPTTKDQMHNKSMDKSTISKSPKFFDQKLYFQVITEALSLTGQNQELQQRLKKQTLKEIRLSFFYPYKRPLETDRVIEHNTRLKEQIKELIIHLDTIMKSQEERKVKEIREQQEIEQNEELVQLKRLLRDQEIEISDNKEQLKQLQRQLQNTYEINHVVEKENLLKQIRNDLDHIVEEEGALQKVKRNQKEALNAHTDYEVEKQLSEIKQKLHSAKESHRALNEELQYSEKVLQKLHTKVFTKQKKAEELHLKIQAAKKIPQTEITTQDVKDLEVEVEELEQEKQNEERNQREQIKEIEQYRMAFKLELEKKSLKLVSIEKDLRLNRIIINEQLRLYKIQLTQQLSKERSELTSQMSNYTSKPNLALRHKSREKSPNRQQSSEKKSQAHRPQQIYKIQPITEVKQERKTTPVRAKTIQKTSTKSHTENDEPQKNRTVPDSKQIDTTNDVVNNDIEEKYDNDFDEEIKIEIKDKKDRNDNIEELQTEANEFNKQEFHKNDEAQNKEESNQIYSKPMLMMKRRK